MQNFVDSNYPSVRLYKIVFKWMPLLAQSQLLGEFTQAASRGEVARRAVVSCDIDDTLFPSLFDTSFPGCRLYPGVLSLLECMRSGGADATHPPHGELPEALQGVPSGTLGFVTARPSLLRSSTRSTLEERSVAAYTLMSGPALPSLRHAAMASDKLRHLRRLKQLWPGRRMVWIGDTGQADAMVGRQLAAEHAEQGGAYLRSGGPLVLMHDIVPKSSTAVPATALQTRHSLATQGVFVFDSYVDASLLALQAGVISCAAALKLAATCCREVGIHPPVVNIQPALVQQWLAAREVAPSAAAASVGAVPLVHDVNSAKEACSALELIAGCNLHVTPMITSFKSFVSSLPMGMGLYGSLGRGGACSCHCPVKGVQLIWRGYQHVARFHQLHSPVCVQAEQQGGAARPATAAVAAQLPAAAAEALGPAGDAPPPAAAYVLRDSPWFPTQASVTAGYTHEEWCCELQCAGASGGADAHPTPQHASHCEPMRRVLAEAKLLRELPACMRALELQAAVGRLVGFVAAVACSDSSRGAPSGKHADE